MRLRLALIALSLACVPAFAQVPDRPTYADRCAAEMGRIPAFNCLAGKLLPITVNGVVQTRTVDACDKPVQLKMIDKQCVPFSRIQELNTGRPGVLTLALCRKYFDRNVAKPEANELFDDIAIIQHDSATGRTCFFQSEVSSKGDRGIDGRRVPSPSDRTAAADAVWMTTSRVGNSVECTKCHAADPFVWSPYIAQTVDVDRWDPHGRYDSNFANLFGNPSKTFRPANNACLDCHHFGRGPKPNVNLTDKRKDNACNALVDALTLQDRPHSAQPKQIRMPPDFGTNVTAFKSAFDASIAQIKRCCATPDLPECRSDIADGRIPRSLITEVWRANGPTCGGSACWQRLDNDLRTRSLAASDASLYQLRQNGEIALSTAPCAGEACGGWTLLDNNPNAAAIAAGAGVLHQLHRNGTVWRYTGTPCKSFGCPGWAQLGNEAKTLAIAMGGIQLYRLDSDGTIATFVGPACSKTACPGWRRLDANPSTVAIAAAPEALYQLHDSGAIWRYTGTPCGAGGCPGWQLLDQNAGTTAIAAAPGALYQLHDDGTIWRFIGLPCTADACPGWVMLDNNPRATAIAAAGGNLYQLHTDGTVWRHTGIPCVGDICPGWTQLDTDGKATSLIAGGNLVYQIRQEQGELRRAERRPRPLGMAATRPR